MAKATPEERFWLKVQKTDGCWLWTGCINAYGYGIFSVSSSRVTNSAGYAYAHRYAYDLLVGPIPEGKQLDHLCRVRHCVRPDHLEPVVVRENLMRGQTHAAANAAKTHCPRGHPYDLVISGHRTCHECKKEQNRRWARNAKLRQPAPPKPPKTHCPQGHPYDEANTYRSPSRPRLQVCKECDRQRSKLYQRRRRARNVEQA